MDMGDRKWSPGCQHPHKDFCTCAVSGRKAAPASICRFLSRYLCGINCEQILLEKTIYLWDMIVRKKKNTPRVHPNLLMQKSMKFTYISA